MPSCQILELETQGATNTDVLNALTDPTATEALALAQQPRSSRPECDTDHTEGGASFRLCGNPETGYFRPAKWCR